MYVQKGVARLSVVSAVGRRRSSPSPTKAHSSARVRLQASSRGWQLRRRWLQHVTVEREEMVRQLHTSPAFADEFFTHMLAEHSHRRRPAGSNIQSHREALARTLLLLARAWGPDVSSRPPQSLWECSPRWSAPIGSGQLLQNKFRQLGFIDYNGGLKVNNSLRVSSCATESAARRIQTQQNEAHRLGATGNCGRHFVKLAAGRGHSVTAVVRDGSRADVSATVTVAGNVPIARCRQHASRTGRGRERARHTVSPSMVRARVS